VKMLSTLVHRVTTQVARRASSTQNRGLKVLAALYEDPVNGYPPKYARDDIPVIDVYPDGQTLPTPKSAGPKPGTLLGCVSGELGLREFLESQGHTLVVVNDKDTPGGAFEQELHDTDIVISQPFWPAYMTRERMDMAPNLKMCMTAGIGSDHVDLSAAIEKNITVTEVTFCNSISVAEHVCMQILGLVRNYIPSYNIIKGGGWNIADAVERSYDVEGMTLGTIASGRIGLAVLERMAPFDMKLQYTDRHRLPAETEARLNIKHQGGDDRASVEKMVQECDVITINCPLYPATQHLFDRHMIAKMKRGSYIVNTARGKICDEHAIADALESGHLAGYAGDVWYPQPPPKDHPWRSMPNHGMTPHMSGTSLSAQHRYCAGVRETLEDFFAGQAIRDEYLVVQGGKLAGVGAASYSEGNATGGSEAAAKFSAK
jgi:formate dehydrogenase